MKFIKSPSQLQLNELQTQLEKNPEHGIVDIWVCIEPFYLLAEENGESIGVASISLGNEAYELYKLYVSKIHRGKGIGTALVNEIIEIAKQNDVSEILIEIAGDSRPFWVNFSKDKSIHCYTNEKFSIKC